MNTFNPSDDYKMYLHLKEKCRDEIKQSVRLINIKRSNDYRLANLEKIKLYQREYNRTHMKFKHCNACSVDVNTINEKKHLLSKKHLKNQQILDGAYNISTITEI